MTRTSSSSSLSSLYSSKKILLEPVSLSCRVFLETVSAVGGSGRISMLSRRRCFKAASCKQEERNLYYIFIQLNYNQLKKGFTNIKLFHKSRLAAVQFTVKSSTTSLLKNQKIIPKESTALHKSLMAQWWAINSLKLGVPKDLTNLIGVHLDTASTCNTSRKTCSTTDPFWAEDPRLPHH